MKCSRVSRRLVARLTLGVAAVWPAAQPSLAQNGYMSPAIAQSGGQFHQASQIPTHMASPLAGGPNAAVGSDFVDAHGNSIVMPASYCGPAGPGPGYCPPMGGDSGAYGDPMGIDFGGYSEDQIGPHYFDVSFGAVFIKSDTILDGVPALASTALGPAAPRVLNPSQGLDSYDPGWEVAVRYDLGPLSVFEATYMGAYDFSFTESAASEPPGTFNLFTIFSNFGVPTPIPGVDSGSLYVLDYNSDLQSSELSYRRYWVGNNPRISGTYLLGFRYVRLTEDLNLNLTADDGNGVGNVVNSNLLWDTSNDLLGFQLGGDGWVGLRQGLRVGGDCKAGVYNNRYKFTGDGDFAAVAGAPSDYTVLADGNQVAFIGEAGISVVADILSSWSLKGGYHVWYIDNLATVGSNIDSSNFVPTVVNHENDALYHGFSASAEYVW